MAMKKSTFLLAGTFVVLSVFDLQQNTSYAEALRSPAGAPVNAAMNNTCGAVTWTPGVSYAPGTIVRYPANNSYYKAVKATSNGTDATDPTVSTWYWSPAVCDKNGWDNKIIAGYYPNWKPSPPRIRDLNPNYNLIYLFAAQSVGGSPGTTGKVFWTPPGNGRGAATNLKADIQYARSIQGRKIILSVGGAGNSMSFPNRAKSQNFVDSIVAVATQLGGVDGLDWDTFEGDQAPDTNEMIWISLELKGMFPGFIISAAPAPWKSLDVDFCQAMIRAGALDYAAPQYYDGPGLADPSYVVSNIMGWVSLLGADHVVVGFGIDKLPNHMSQAQAVSTWDQVKANHPSIRGAFDWEIGTDEAQGWPFAIGLGPLIQ